MFKEHRRQKELIYIEKSEGHVEVEGSAEGCFCSLKKKIAKLALVSKLHFLREIKAEIMMIFPADILLLKEFGLLLD